METKIKIGSNYITITKQMSCLNHDSDRTITIIFYFVNDTTVAMYSGNINIIYFMYELRKLGIKNLILDIKSSERDLKPYLIRILNRQFKPKSNFNIKNYLDEYLETQPYTSTNGSNMNLCNLDISKLKLRDLNR